MTRRASIEFVEVTSPIREAETKFGGQPHWLELPQWPISRQTQRPMRFIGQIAVSADLFGEIPGKMAYLFMTDEEEFVDGTYEADGGENGVVIQPGRVHVPVQPLAQGPTLYRMVEQPGHDRLVPQPCEFAVNLTVGEDPPYEPEKRTAEYYEALAGNKIGGTPGFLQGDEFPGDEYRRLLVQLDATQVPFYVNFGDAGIGYAFLSRSGDSAKFLWQCG